ncbi:MAG: hypothetical protein Q7T59_04785 [Candidatus Woesebacteria bacterium]|nr:hypothetical protein [Candidatus Woesebacteria bacterium]
MLSLLMVPGIYLLMPKPALAVCPVCTIAVAGGLGLSRYFGIDDTITGIWVGGLMVSLTLWLVNWLIKKDFKLFKKVDEKTRILLSFLLWTLLTYPPLYWANIIGHPFNTILGIDKLVFGSLIGIPAFLLGVYFDKKVRRVKGKQLFQFQRVVFPFTVLLIFSLVLYFWGGYLYKFK